MNTNHKNAAESSAWKRNAVWFALLLLILASALICVFLLRGCSNSEAATGLPKAFTLDPTAVEGGWDEADVEAIVDGLNEKVDKGMINISMNTAPVFADGEAEGNLMIVNESVNNYPQIVEITRNDTGELIYRSGGIPVGSKIESAKLDVELPAGMYECTALFHNVDPATGESLGCAGAIITITVLA